jgi:hypothetical protein
LGIKKSFIHIVLATAQILFCFSNGDPRLLGESRIASNSGFPFRAKKTKTEKELFENGEDELLTRRLPKIGPSRTGAVQLRLLALAPLRDSEFDEEGGA